MDLSNFLPLPQLASAHGHEIDFLIHLIHILMLVLFIGWAVYFCFVIYRFRQAKNPKANYHGVKNHAATYVEIGVAVFEAVLLIAFAVPFWIKQINTFPQRTDTIELRMVAEQFAWNFHYPGPDGKFGNTDFKFFDKQSNPLGIDPNDPNGKDDFTTINQLHLPIGRPAVIQLTSRDVIHSFSIPAMRVKQDTNPGISIPIWFTPTKSGEFEIACAQLCGLGHYRMRGMLTVHHEDSFQQWYDTQVTAASSSSSGDDFWN